MKTLQIVLLLATPCLAEKREPAGLFRLEGTLWEADAPEDWGSC
jgi:hypothetical protein